MLSPNLESFSPEVINSVNRLFKESQLPFNAKTANKIAEYIKTYKRASIAHNKIDNPRTLLVGSKSVGSQFSRLQKNNPELVESNEFLSSLRLNKAYVGQFETSPMQFLNLSTGGRKMTSEVVDRMINGFRDLLNDKETKAFAEDLIKYSFITSANMKSSKSFFHLIPSEYLTDKEGKKPDTNYVSDAAVVSYALHNPEDIFKKVTRKNIEGEWKAKDGYLMISATADDEIKLGSKGFIFTKKKNDDLSIEAGGPEYRTNYYTLVKINDKGNYVYKNHGDFKSEVSDPYGNGSYYDFEYEKSSLKLSSKTDAIDGGVTNKLMSKKEFKKNVNFEVIGKDKGFDIVVTPENGTSWSLAPKDKLFESEETAFNTLYKSYIENKGEILKTSC